MKPRKIVITLAILSTMWHSAAAQQKKSKTQVDGPPLETVLIGTRNHFDRIISDLIAVRPEMPLGPQDVLKAYEIAMSLVAERVSTDLSLIVQSQQINQISREQAEYLVQQKYQVAMMQYQVLGALHDVLKHAIEEATQPSKRSVKPASSDTVVVLRWPRSDSDCK